MAKMKFIAAFEHSECGMACVVMLINYFGQKINLTYLREKYGVPRGGLSIAQMCSLFQNLG
ncbi:MAG: hypothetical protein LBT80_05510 [Lactobacillaceae bacterium]|jgi:ABC-type bacteriocin/lantibiotic exporter with double-glycine peptidase domain|nr:hypothetical protein [Lactobacillaceae bacterium]